MNERMNCSYDHPVNKRKIDTIIVETKGIIPRRGETTTRLTSQSASSDSNALN